MKLIRGIPTADGNWKHWMPMERMKEPYAFVDIYIVQLFIYFVHKYHILIQYTVIYR